MLNPALLKAAQQALPACPDPVRRAFALLTAPVQPCGHEAELERLRAEVARLTKELAKVPPPKLPRPRPEDPRAPCKVCGTLIRKTPSNRCRACYLAACATEQQAVLEAVAKVNADPDRPRLVVECWKAAAVLLGKEWTAVRSLGERAGARVLPRAPRMTTCQCGAPVMELWRGKPRCKVCL